MKKCLFLFAISLVSFSTLTAQNQAKTGMKSFKTEMNSFCAGYNNQTFLWKDIKNETTTVSGKVFCEAYFIAEAEGGSADVYIHNALYPKTPTNYIDFRTSQLAYKKYNETYGAKLTQKQAADDASIKSNADKLIASVKSKVTEIQLYNAAVFQQKNNMGVVP